MLTRLTDLVFPIFGADRLLPRANDGLYSRQYANCLLSHRRDYVHKSAGGIFHAVGNNVA
jgi:hypothetical protein